MYIVNNLFITILHTIYNTFIKYDDMLYYFINIYTKIYKAARRLLQNYILCIYTSIIYYYLPRYIWYIIIKYNEKFKTFTYF